MNRIAAHPYISVGVGLLAVGIYIGYVESPAIQTTKTYAKGAIDGAIIMGLAVITQGIWLALLV